MAIDISVVITAHHEGDLAHHTLQSVWRGIRHAAEHGLHCEVLVVLDRADAATRDYFAKHQPHVSLWEVDFGDSGPARNFGARRARGRYVCFLDGDDLYCQQWLYRAYQQAEATSGAAVFHPSCSVRFGADTAFRAHRSSREPDFCALDLLEHWHWRLTPFLGRNLALQHPFAECLTGSGFGYEDWHWYCELLAAGVAVLTVDETCFFYRIRAGSRSGEHSLSETVLRPSRLFDPQLLRQQAVAEADEEEYAASIDPARSAEQPSQSVSPPSLLVRAWRTPLRYWPWKAARRLLPFWLRQRVKAFSRHVPQMLRSPLRFTLMPPEQMPLTPTATLPRWLLQEWRDLSALEPETYPDRATLEKLEELPYPPKSQVGTAYVRLCRQTAGPASHVFLVPWLQKGGSDRTAINYVKALHNRGLADGMVVIATEAEDSPWARHLPPSVTFVPFGRQFAHLDLKQRESLLLRFLLQKQPQVVHNINSALGYRIYSKHARALAHYCRLYAHMFCDDVSGEGRIAGYNRLYLPKCMPHLTAVISDNQTEIEKITAIFPFDPARFYTHYQPVDLAPMRRPPLGGRLEVLWAGRLDRQKRPDLLGQIADVCRDLPITFHAFGAPLLDGNWSCPVRPNIRFHGPFDGFGSLPLEQFDVFLYTSQWDGLPNILLEAGASGLPIIAADVGGVHELVRHGETGLLARPYDAPRQYREALVSLLSGEADAQQLTGNTLRLLAERHSWHAFTEALGHIPGYVGLAGPGATRREPCEVACQDEVSASPGTQR